MICHGSRSKSRNRDDYETVRVLQDFIDCNEFKSIDVGVEYEAGLALATVSREAFVIAITNLSRLTGEAGRQPIPL